MNKKRILKLVALSAVLYTGGKLIESKNIVVMADDNVSIVNQNDITDTETQSNSSVVSNNGTGNLLTSEENENVIYSNDFENRVEPSETTENTEIVNISENKAMKFTTHFDGTDNWDNNKHEFTFYTSSNQEISENSIIQFDVLIPTAQVSYNGIIKYSGGITDKDWNWVGAGYGDINSSDFKDEGNGYSRKTVSIKTSKKSDGLTKVIVQIAAYNCDYKGELYIDNIKLAQEEKIDIYVKKEVELSKQEEINIADLETPKQIKLVDENATKEATSLYAYLMGVGKTDKVLYGHQNDTHHKAVLKESGTNSDTKDITGSIAAISGIDTLSLTGAELHLTDEEKAQGVDLATKAANLGIEASDEGGIITLSSHMPNFALVAENGKVDGKYDYSGYTPNVTTGDVASRIMPGGDLNEVYTGYLDLVADYGKKLQNAGVPVLFRPFHENNGSWFWWGKAFCDEEAYKNLFRYTVEYLRDSKDIHNFLYVYSPNGPFEDKEEYLSRYPGDEFIDIIAFDMYHDDPLADSSKDPWMNSFKETIDLVQGIAKEKGKLSAVSETGIRYNGGATIVSGNPNKDWFQNISDIISSSDMTYYMVWANFDTNNFFAPYMVNDIKGHEMINEFINYYNDDKSIFANETGNYKGVETSIEDSYSYGFITYPASRNRILSPTTITAKVKGYNDDVKFVIKNKNGEIIETIKAVLNNNIYSGSITQDILNKAGESIGTIDLYSGDKKLNSIKAIFNIKEVEQDPKVVDDFESYIGENDLLENSWATNAGPGCSISPKLTEDKVNSGEYRLMFNYNISTEKTSEGWAGITKTVGADWTGTDALRLWAEPDGYGQKLVIQVTSNGEDFEVYLSDFAATTEAKVLTIPFSEFKGKNGGTLDLSNIEKMGIWCNTIVPEDHEGAWTVDSVMYFDDIKAINTNETDNGNSGLSSSLKQDTTVESTENTSAIGWFKNSNGEWFYKQEDGSMKIGWFKDRNGSWYYLQSNGVMASNEIIDGYEVNENGEWIS